jgi:hypothetical protein
VRGVARDPDPRRVDPQPSPAALYAIGNQRGHLADRLVTPWWYHPTLGGALALFVASFATRSLVVVGAGALVYLAALVSLPRLYRRATGVWVQDHTPGRAQRWARALGFSAVGCLVVGMTAAAVGAWPVTLLVAAVAFGTTQVFGRRFDEELREELRADPEIGFKIEEA